MAFNGWLIKRDPRIHNLGYIEHLSKKGLFWKNCSPGIAFLDHRIDTDFPYKMQYEAGARHYFSPKEPQWKSIRNKRFEEAFLIEHGIKFDPPIVDSYETVSELTGRPEDGYCQFCNKDFQDKGVFCNSECERDFKNQVHWLCEACQEPIDIWDAVRHHVSYFPEEIVNVHQKCHMEIHRTDKYLHLRPAQDDTDRYYKKGKFANYVEKLSGLNRTMETFSHFH